MEPSTIARSLWLGPDASVPAPDRLRQVVAGLTRARRLQLLLDHVFGGLLVGLGLATVAVLVVRLAPLPYSPLQLAFSAVVASVLIALLIGWYGRPSSLDVAIHADLALRLKQRLSTAWEYMALHGEPGLVERLAAQAVNARLPAHPGLVFPLRVNRWGWFAPLAATALLLAAVLDLNRIQAPAPYKVDERVADEGQRLGAFAKEMHARATRDELPRSAKQAEQLERLGARMEGGRLTRSEALGLLRQFGKALQEEGRKALTGGDGKPIDPRRPPGEGSSRGQGQNPGTMTERMLREGPGRESSRELQQYLDALERSGIPRQEGEEALRRHQAGDRDQLRDILEKLAKLEQARREYEELQDARAQVLRAQENLGAPQAATPGMHASPIDINDEDDERDGDPVASVDIARQLSGEMSRGASRYGKQSDSSIAAERHASPLLPEREKSGPLLKPQGQIRRGEELVTQGQVLPRVGRPGVESVPMKAEFASQVEEVLSREQYPAHSKEFIRRYFLNLSQGARATPSPKEGAQ